MKANLNPTIVDEKNIIFDPIIFDRNQWFLIELLIIHQRGDDPAIGTMGKIAGIQRIGIEDNSGELAKLSFFSEVFSGSIWVNVARTVIFAVIFLLGVIVVVILTVAIVLPISSLREKYRRKKIHRVSESLSDISLEHRNTVEDLYAMFGKKGLKDTVRFLEDEDVAERTMKRYGRVMGKYRDRRTRSRTEPFVGATDIPYEEAGQTIGLGIIELLAQRSSNESSDDLRSIDPELLKSIRQILDRLENSN